MPSVFSLKAVCAGRSKQAVLCPKPKYRLSYAYFLFGSKAYGIRLKQTLVSIVVHYGKLQFHFIHTGNIILFQITGENG